LVALACSRAAVRVVVLARVDAEAVVKLEKSARRK